MDDKPYRHHWERHDCKAHGREYRSEAAALRAHDRAVQSGVDVSWVTKADGTETTIIAEWWRSNSPTR